MTMRGIDTLAVARKLESAGVERVQAEAHAEALNEVVVIKYADLATKADLDRFATKEDLGSPPRRTWTGSPPRRTLSEPRTRKTSWTT